MLPASRLVALAALGSLWLGCGSLGGSRAPEEPIAARVGDDVITVAEVDAAIKDELFARETKNGNPARLHEVRTKALRGLVARRALDQEAEGRGLSTDALLEEEFAKLPPITDADVQAFYDKNAGHFQGSTLEQLAPRIRSHLENEARAKALDAVVARHAVDIELERPRVEVRSEGPARGPAGARVTIVEYSDFQCPFCRRALPVLDEITSRYPNDVRVVYRHLPLDSLHPRARASAEASACAAEGNKFWEYHDRLFDNTQALSDEDLRRYAKEVGLDPQSFDECVRTRRHAAAIEADEEEARRIGVSGTPAFVVNGIVLFGLQTTDALDRVVREELGLAEAGS